MLNSRTPLENISAIQDANPNEEADTAPQFVVAPAGELSSLPPLIIRPGESGGMLTQTEYVVSKFCAEHRLKKYTGDALLAMIRRKDFVREDIRYETIRELEQIIEKGLSLIHI